MTCSKCGTINNAEYIYCVNCGTSIPGTPNGAVKVNSGMFDDAASVQTTFPPVREPVLPTQQFGMPTGNQQVVAKKSKLSIIVAIGVAGVFFVVVAAAAFWFLTQNQQPVEIVPDHLGIFYLNPDRTSIKELVKTETANVLTVKDRLLNDATKFSSVGAPEVILYSDGSVIPLNDLKFIDLESIGPEGTMKQIDFQVIPVDGNQAMKKLKFPNGLANGKYAFAVFNGPLDDGKHRFWPIQIENSTKVDNNEKPLTVVLSDGLANPKANTNTAPTPQSAPSPPKPKVDGPVGSTVAYCNSSDVIVRASAGLDAKRLTMLKKGQRVFVIRYSENTDVWKGTESNWAYVQTENGKRGWVFTPFISNSE